MEENELDKNIFVELLMLPGSSLLGKTLSSLQNFMLQDIIPIAIKKRKTLINLKDRIFRGSMNRLVLEVGDRLLVEISKEKLTNLNIFYT